MVAIFGGNPSTTVLLARTLHGFGLQARDIKAKLISAFEEVSQAVDAGATVILEIDPALGDAWKAIPAQLFRLNPTAHLVALFRGTPQQADEMGVRRIIRCVRSSELLVNPPHDALRSIILQPV